MRCHTTLRAAHVAALVALLTACGGSSSGTAGIDRGGVRAPAYASGSITAFGSIIVRGERYTTDSATIIVDGIPSIEAELAVGHIVAVASDADGSVERVELDRDLVGPIDAIDGTVALTVLGQSVRLDATTSFDRDVDTHSLAGLATGDVIEISGFYAADGTLLAGRIERAPVGVAYRVHGFVADVDTANKTFRLNALTVDYSTATTIDGFQVGEPRNGDFVLVSGTGSGPLRATALRRERRAPFDVAAAPFTATIEGLVTRFAGRSDFDIDGQAAALTASATLANGTAADLRLDRRATATGSIGTNGVLSVTALTFAPVTNVRIQAPVTAVEVAAGTLTVLGTQVRVLADTYLEDLSGGNRAFTLADVVAGDWVGVYGYEDPADSNRMTATRLERDNDDADDIEIVGPVKSLADPEFSILGIRVLTDSATEFDDIDRADFFAGPPGEIVEVEGRLQGNIVLALEVEGD